MRQCSDGLAETGRTSGARRCAPIADKGSNDSEGKRIEGSRHWLGKTWGRRLRRMRERGRHGTDNTSGVQRMMADAVFADMDDAENKTGNGDRAQKSDKEAGASERSYEIRFFSDPPHIGHPQEFYSIMLLRRREIGEWGWSLRRDFCFDSARFWVRRLAAASLFFMQAHSVQRGRRLRSPGRRRRRKR